jgi:hypothetical protein
MLIPQSYAQLLNSIVVNREPRLVMTRLGMPKRYMMSWMNSTALAALYLTSGLYSIHLVNLLMATKIYSNPPLAFLSGPT